MDKQPALPAKFLPGNKVYKNHGYLFPGTVRSAFAISCGKWRYVVEHKTGGLLHIFNGEQLTLESDRPKKKRARVLRCV